MLTHQKYRMNQKRHLQHVRACYDFTYMLIRKHPNMEHAHIVVIVSYENNRNGWMLSDDDIERIIFNATYSRNQLSLDDVFEIPRLRRTKVCAKHMLTMMHLSDVKRRAERSNRDIKKSESRVGLLTNRTDVSYSVEHITEPFGQLDDCNNPCIEGAHD